MSIDAWGDGWELDTSCSGGVCGTGEWAGPKPGDPDNNVTLSATGTVGGINVSWSYPLLLPHAVAHTLLYRSDVSEFAKAVQQGVIAGNRYFDKIPDTAIHDYFYWIKIVSVNGTVGELIGPAIARPESQLEDLLEKLTAQIDEGYLAQSLKERIGLLDILNTGLGAEVKDRIHNNELLLEALSAVQLETGEATTFLRNEIKELVDADSAMLESINIMAVGMGENAAAITEEKEVRVSAVESLASRMDVMYTTLGGNEAAITAERTARSKADSALAQRIDIVVSQTNGFAAAIQAEQTARTNQDSALATQINTAQAKFGTDLASVQTTMTASINAVDGKKNNLGALYMTKVNVGDLVGGFGIYNNGSFVEAGFDVDRFWVGRTVNKVKPFIIEGGVVYIDKTRIKTADIDTLKIAGNAVTVPSYAVQSGMVAGNGSMVNICSVYVSNAGNPSPMNAIIIAGGLAGYAAGLRATRFSIVQDGSITLNDSGDITADYVTTPTLMGYGVIAAYSSATFTFMWKGATNDVFLSGGKIVILGAKR